MLLRSVPALKVFRPLALCSGVAVQDAWGECGGVTSRDELMRELSHSLRSHGLGVGLVSA